MNSKILISRKAFHFSLIFGLLCSVFLSFAQFNAACDDLRTNVLRLHIIANSDSKEDQQLKLKIRDRILETSADLFDGAENITDAEKLACQSLGVIEKMANDVIRENNFSYEAKVKIGKSYFETREYEDFTLPAGTYNSLIVTLGEGEGKNWWCVIFPEVCLPVANDASLSDTVADESSKIATNSERYVMRFKAVEIYEDIKKLFNR